MGKVEKNEEVKGNGEEKRGTITDENINEMIDTWEDTTPEALAEKFGIKLSTVANVAARLRKLSDGKACPLKRAKKKDDVFKDILKQKGLLNDKVK